MAFLKMTILWIDVTETERSVIRVPDDSESIWTHNSYEEEFSNQLRIKRRFCYIKTSQFLHIGK
jgi:hypothetical protein